MSRWFSICVLLTALALMNCVALLAQQAVSGASLSGLVLDPGGKVVAHAKIAATEVATGQTHTTVTDARGSFRFPYLPVGSYQVRASAPDFAPAIQQIQLTIGSAFHVTLHLTLADTSTTVNVTSAAPLIEAGSSQIAGTVAAKEIRKLPFEGRNYLDLSLLMPGVSPANTGSRQMLAETSDVVGQGYSINGERNFSNSFIVDGLSANDNAAGVAGNVLSMDVVREFQVVTSGGQAEFGRSLGGYINIVTKSGSNHLHGSAYGFLRNQRWNAANALTGNTLPLTQGIYGASLSGPLQKNKSFLFGNFEEGRLNTDGVIAIAPGNAAQVNARLAATGYKAPMLATSGAATTLYPTTLHTDTVFLRADHSFSPTDQGRLRYSLYKLSSIHARGAGGLSAVSAGTSVFDTNNTISFGNIATFSPRTFNETRGQFVSDDLSAPPVDGVGPAVTIAGIASFGRSSASPTRRLNYLYELVDNLVMDRGAHSLKAGANFLLNDNRITFPMALRGSYTFSSLDNFLSGIYNQQGFRQNFGKPSVRQINPNLGLYFQDTWQAASSVTINAGIRYDTEYLKTIHTDMGDIAPRLGFAWAPFPASTVIRGGYGLYYGVVPLRPLANSLLSAGNTTNPAKAKLLGYTYSPGQTGAPAFPEIAAAPPANTPIDFSIMNRRIRSPYAQQANLAIEQRLTGSSTLSVSYQFARGMHLLGSVNTNIFPDGSHPNPLLGNVRSYNSLFDSCFNGLEVLFVQRASAWGSARLSYTYSKAIDDVGEFFYSSPVNNFDPKQDRGRSSDDHRHRLVLDGTLNSPTLSAAGWKRSLMRGWSLSGILEYDSAPPINIVTGTTSLQGTVLRPCIPGYSLEENGGVNPCTEAQPGAVIGRNTGVGFGYFDVDTRLARTFAVDRRVHLSIMVEAFNTFNHRNNMFPNATWGPGAYPANPAATFGQPTAVGDPRSLQLATRLNF